MKNPKNTVWRIALFLLTVVCGLLMADRGENEFPVFACSEALSGESGSTGLLLQQNMWEVVPLLGYGIVEQQGTQNPEEDETTCRTLTTEDLISDFRSRRKRSRRPLSRRVWRQQPGLH